MSTAIRSMLLPVIAAAVEASRQTAEENARDMRYRDEGATRASVLRQEQAATDGLIEIVQAGPAGWNVMDASRQKAPVLFRRLSWHVHQGGKWRPVSPEEAAKVVWAMFSGGAPRPISQAAMKLAAAKIEVAWKEYEHGRKLLASATKKGGDPMVVYVGRRGDRPGDFVEIPNVRWLREFFADPAPPAEDDGLLIFSEKKNGKNKICYVTDRGQHLYGERFIIAMKDPRTGFPMSISTEAMKDDVLHASALCRTMASDVAASEEKREKKERLAAKNPAAYAFLLSKVPGRPAEVRSAVRGSALALIRKVFGSVESATFRGYGSFLILCKNPALWTSADRPNLRHEILGAAFGVYHGPVLIFGRGMTRERSGTFPANVYTPATELQESDLAFLSEADAKKAAKQFSKKDPNTEINKAKEAVEND